MLLQSSFFFFQAEDGIRDYKVTGVQTCALPIYRRDPREVLVLQAEALVVLVAELAEQLRERRSEERRVGKSVDLGGRRIIKKKKKGGRITRHRFQGRRHQWVRLMVRGTQPGRDA